MGLLFYFSFMIFIVTQAIIMCIAWILSMISPNMSCRLSNDLFALNKYSVLNIENLNLLKLFSSIKYEMKVVSRPFLTCAHKCGHRSVIFYFKKKTNYEDTCTRISFNKSMILTNLFISHANVFSKSCSLKSKTIA